MRCVRLQAVFPHAAAAFVGLATVLLTAAPAFAQLVVRPDLPRLASGASSAAIPDTPGELHGVIHDEHGAPLAGAVVSALGAMSAFAVSDREGRFTFRNLTAGPYLVRAHLQGYVPARARVFQVTAGGRNVSNLVLTRRATSADTAPRVLAAGVVAPASETPDEETHDHDETAWRLRHGKRSVLKDAEYAIAGLDHDSLLGGSIDSVTWAVGSSARLASSLFADLPINGQFNLMTTASFDRPQDLFAMNAGAPRGVAYLALAAPGASGDWAMRGTVTQGDVSSWIVAGSYVRHQQAGHQYEAGVSYSMQRYLGGNGDALAAMRDGSRNVGSIYAYDTWAVVPRVRVGYGAKWDSYDYLDDRRLFSPRASVSVRPVASDSLLLRATVLHREAAPGAQEFLPPTAGPWLPPERTFSQVSRGAFSPERVDHVEVAAEREWPGAPNVIVGVRAFRQRIDDQIVTVFGAIAAEAPRSTGHYQVGSAGDVDTRGWGMSVSTAVGSAVRASVDYTQLDADWQQGAWDRRALATLARSTRRLDERVHDVTTSIESAVAATATRFLVVYKFNTAYAAENGADAPLASARFNVQVNQSLPFMRFSSAEWEMLAAVSNLFHSEVFEGSMYDELLVVGPPKRVLGGVTVKF